MATEHTHDKRLSGKEAAVHLFREHGINLMEMKPGTRASTTHDAQHPEQVESRKMPIERVVKQLIRVYGYDRLIAELNRQHADG